MTSHDQRLSLATERHDEHTFADAQAAVGAVVKFAACLCDDGTHGFPDRAGWVVSEQLAFDDWLATDPERAHVVIRFTAVLDNARDVLIDTLAKSDGLTGERARPLLRAVYGPTADRLIAALGGAR